MRVTNEMVTAAKAVLRDCERESCPVDAAVRKMLDAAMDAWWDMVVRNAIHDSEAARRDRAACGECNDKSGFLPAQRA